MIIPIRNDRCRCVCVGVLMLGFARCLAAAPVDTLGTAEVVGSRLVKGMSSTIPLQRIDTADIRLRGMTDIGDALRRLSGVNIRDYGGAGGLKTVSVRGLGAEHTRIVYNGLSVSNARQGQVDLQRFNLDQLAQIELQTLDTDRLLSPVRNLGAATLYLTSRYGNASPGSLKGQAALHQASFNSWNPSLSLQYTTPHKTYIGMCSDYFFADNDYPFFVRNGVASQWLNRTNSRMQTASGAIDWGRNWTTGQWHAQISGMNSDRRLPGQVVLYVNENDERLKEQHAVAQLYYQQHKDRLEWFAAGKLNWEKNHYTDQGGQYPDGLLRENYIQREAYVSAGCAYTLLPGLRLAYATDGIVNTMNSNLKDDNHVKRTTWLHSLSLRLKTERFSLTARGLAHLYDNEREGHKAARNEQRITPTLSASYRVFSVPVQLYLRAGYKESFRLPTFTESYFRHLGSTDLQPELARQINGGLTLQTRFSGQSPNVSLTCDFYYNKITDHIVSVPYNLFVWRTINLGDVRTTGLDVTLNGQWNMAKGHSLLLAAGYTYQRARDCMPTNLSTYGNQLAYTPRHSGSGSLTWDNPWLSVVAHVTWSDKRWATPEHMATTLLPAYKEWGFALFRSFALGKVRLAARADLINAFNEHYEIVRRYPMPGRSYKLGITTTF